MVDSPSRTGTTTETKGFVSVCARSTGAEVSRGEARRLGARWFAPGRPRARARRGPWRARPRPRSRTCRGPRPPRGGGVWPGRRGPPRPGALREWLAAGALADQRHLEVALEGADLA